MIKRIGFLTLAAIMMVSLQAHASGHEAYPEAMAARPLVLTPGLLEVGLDLDFGLNKDRAFKDILVGVGFAWGVVENLEIGADVVALNYGADAQGANFGSVDLYARYAFLDSLGAELRLYLPGDAGLGPVGPRAGYIDSFGDQLLGLSLGLPFQYIALKDTLKLHAGLAFDIGFVSDDYITSGGDSPQMALLLAYGVTYSVLPRLFFDLTFGTRMGFTGPGSFGDRTSIPAALTIGGTMLGGNLDIGAYFALHDLMPAVGGAFDGKSIGLGTRFRF